MWRKAGQNPEYDCKDIYESERKWVKENSEIQIDGVLYKVEDVKKAMRTLQLREMARRIAKKN